jgi:hypothetical protein
MPCCAVAVARCWTGSVLRHRRPCIFLRLLGTTPNEEVGTTVSVLLRSRGLGRSSVQSRDSENRRLAICIAGGESQGSTQATLELFLLPARAPRRKNSDASSSILVRPCGSSPPLPSHNAAMIPDDLTSRIIAGRASDSASRVRA